MARPKLRSQVDFREPVGGAASPRESVRFSESDHMWVRGQGNPAKVLRAAVRMARENPALWEEYRPAVVKE